MSKEEIIENIRKGTENLYMQDEVIAYKEGYLQALLDTYEMDRSLYWEIWEEA